MTPLLTISRLTKRFTPGGPAVVEDVSLEVGEGELFVLVGPSGCGKTTALRMVAGLERPDEGKVMLDGRTLVDVAGGRGVVVPPQRRGVGLVFQDYALFPHLSVLENVAFGVRRERWSEHLPWRRRASRRRRSEVAREHLWRVKLASVEGRAAHELSGGQQQRVALARALAAGSRVVLLDEPFSNLDRHVREEMRDRIRKLAATTGVAVVLVTHDQEEAMSLADRLAVMHGGRLEQVGPPRDVYARPDTAFVAQFLGGTNLIRAHCWDTNTPTNHPTDTHTPHARTPLGRVTLDRPATGQVTISLRPEHIAVLPPDQATDADPHATVIASSFKGHDHTCRVTLDGLRGVEYTLHTPHDAPHARGDRLRLRPCGHAVVVRDQPG